MSENLKKKDFKIKVGDIITAYKAGYHEVIDIEDRWFGIGHQIAYDGNPEPDGVSYCPLITYVPLFDDRGTTINSKRKSFKCDVAFCKPALEVAKQKLDAAQKVYDLLK